jgi:hypothetical protein
MFLFTYKSEDAKTADLGATNQKLAPVLFTSENLTISKKGKKT